MKRTLTYLTLGILLPLFSSCIFDEVIETENVSEDMMVTFTLDVKSQTSTRAADDNTWGDAYFSAVGDGYDSYINPQSLQVFAYGNDGSFIAQMPILRTSDYDGKVSFLCSFPKSNPYSVGVSYRIMVLANCTSRNYGLSLNSDGTPNINSLTFSSDLVGQIPMWGVKTYKIPAEKPADNTFDLGGINLLRATAKIGVKLSAALEDEGYSIAGLQLNYANANGYCAPSGWNAEGYTDYLEHDKAFRPLATNEITDISNVAMSKNERERSYYIYVPETENKTSDALSIAVTLKKGEGESAQTIEFPYDKGIRFCDYDDDGKPTNNLFNIVRNHFYDYTISAINLGLKMELVVADWEDEDVWNLDFSAPINTRLMTAPRADAPAPTEIPSMYYDNSDASGEKGAFVGYFMMESPEGMTWRPTLANASSTDYTVRVYKTNTADDDYNVLVTDSAILAEKGYFYKIVVVPLNPINVNNVIKLGLTYTASWNQDANPLLIINKADTGAGFDGLYYPNTGFTGKDTPDIHWISIRQVDRPMDVSAE